jgi:hypothetical protein
MDYTSERRGRFCHGWYLGRIYEIHENEAEIILFRFADPNVERQYQEYLDQSSRRTDLIAVCVALSVTFLYTTKGDFSTHPAQILHLLARTSLSCNFTWLVTLVFLPSLASIIRRPVVFTLNWVSHLIIACLPPLTYKGIKPPPSAVGAFMVGMLGPVHRLLAVVPYRYFMSSKSASLHFILI